MSDSNLVLLLGAGFSAPYDVPPMKPLYDGFVRFAKTKYPQLSETLDAVLEKCQSDADVEELISKLNRAAAADQGLPAHLLEDERLRKWKNDAEYLRWHLTSYIIEACENFDRQLAIECCGHFFRQLAVADAQPPIEIFTTNYDRVVEHICEAENISLADGFERQEGVLVNPWSADFDSQFRILKLHGSVTWYRYSDSGGGALRLDRGYPLPDPSFRLSTAGKALEPLMVLPTLEKEISEEPYGHLFQRFTHTLNSARVVVIIGNSLRDAHLLSALRYIQEKLVFLVIDRDPSSALESLDAAHAVGLSADIGEFFRSHGSQLAEALESTIQLPDQSEILDSLRDFVTAYRDTISARQELDSAQQHSLDNLAASDEFVVLDALQKLRGVTNSAVIQQTIEILDSPSTLIRKSAAGNLGIAGAAPSIEKLEALAESDPDASVRMEAELAVKRVS